MKSAELWCPNGWKPLTGREVSRMTGCLVHQSVKREITTPTITILTGKFRCVRKGVLWWGEGWFLDRILVSHWLIGQSVVRTVVT